MARLLIVDDEASLCDLLKRYLARHGHEVDTAANPSAALDQFRSHGYDIVVTDLKFETGNGEELLERMRRDDPKLRAILCSGYPHQTHLSGVEFMQKPFL